MIPHPSSPPSPSPSPSPSPPSPGGAADLSPSPSPSDAAMDHHHRHHHHHHHHQSAMTTDLSPSQLIRSRHRSADDPSSLPPVAESDPILTEIRSHQHISIDSRIPAEAEAEAGAEAGAENVATRSDSMDPDLHLVSAAANLRPLKRLNSPGRENQTDSARRIHAQIRHSKGPIKCQIDRYGSCRDSEEEEEEEARDRNHVHGHGTVRSSQESSEESEDSYESEAGSFCVTPTGKEFRIPEPKICPPAPKKHRRHNTVIRSPDSPSGLTANHTSNYTELSSSSDRRRSAMDPDANNNNNNSNSVIHDNCRSENSICFFRPQPDELHTIPDFMKTLFST